MHHLLERQLRNCFGKEFQPDAVLQSLLAVVEQYYRETDKERQLLQNTLRVSSAELNAANERERSNNAEMTRTLLNTLSDGVYATDLNGNLTFLNAAAEQVLGWQEQELIGRPVHQALQPTLPDGAEFSSEDSPQLQAIRQVDAVECTCHFVTRVGHFIPVKARARPILMEGKLTGALVSFQDIRQIKEAQDNLRQAYELQRKTLTELEFQKYAIDQHDIVSMSDPDGKIIYANDRLLEVSQHSREELLGQDHRLLNSGYHSHEFFKTMWNTIGHGEIWRGEVRNRRKDGTFYWVDSTIVPSMDSAGTVLRYVSIRTDITARKQTEQAMLAAKEEAESANIAKSRFLATMSHEIRTPMNAILGMAQVLLMPKITESERLDYARTIVSSGHTLLTLLNDILDLSKIEAGKVNLESIPFEPEQVISETRALFAEISVGKGLQISSEWNGPPKCYLGDPHRLRQMLSNLVGNAIKFTTQGAIRIEAREVDCNAHSATLEFAIIDTGPGIANDKQDLLFRSFSQTDNSITRSYGGTGLGLSIVKNLAQLMGGEVGVQSEEGRGSRFWFRISAELPEPDAVSTWSEMPASGMKAAGSIPTQLAGRVLVVEDNSVNQKVLSVLLSKMGVKVVLANDGQQGLDAVLRGESVDLILMDLQMPIMDGYVATQKIRQWEASNGRPRLPIIALTASAFLEDRMRCMAVGMDNFVFKPIQFETLVAVLNKWLPAAVIQPATSDSIASANKVVDKAKVIKLVNEIMPLLEQSKFDSIGLFRELRESVRGTDLEAEIAEAGQQMDGFHFDLVLDRLHQIMAAKNWREESIE